METKNNVKHPIAAKQEERVVKKVVNGNVKVKKKSGARKFAEVFVSEDAANVKNYIFMDVLVPAIKKAIADIVTDGIHMVLYGDSGRHSKNAPASKMAYGSFFQSSKRPEQRQSYRTYDYNNVSFETRGDAEAVLMQLEELISMYGTARVADLYEMAGVTGTYTDNDYGWTDLRMAEVTRTRNGEYVIRLPRAIPIKK